MLNREVIRSNSRQLLGCGSHLVDRSIVPIKEKAMGIKPGPKRIADSTGKPDKRQRDNKDTPGNTPSLKPHKHKKGD